MNKNANRREFIRTGVTTGAALSALASSFTASSYGQILGANDKIRIGMIGCGGRASWHIGWVHRSSQEANAQIVAACDIWKQKLENGIKLIKDRFGTDPKPFKEYKKLLEEKDIHAVVIATPDHQHCTMLSDAVLAGKDVYVEKPIAVTLQELNEVCDTVKKSKSIVQHGTQGRSSAGAAAAREFIQSGKLGQMLRVEESRSYYVPYWNNYALPEKEEDTDWKAFLFNRPDRPFNADMHGCWMGYRDFSSGTVGGWMSHFIDFTQSVTGCGFPLYATAQGGIYAPTSDKRRTCPDTVTAILHYAEGFTTLYTTHFGNGANDYTKFFGSKGTMVIRDPDGNNGGIAAKVSGEGSEHPGKVKEPVELENTTKEDHIMNWLNCIRSRKQPNADMDKGYMHGVACVLADMAYVEGEKMTYDPQKREIRPA